MLIWICVPLRIIENNDNPPSPFQSEVGCKLMTLGHVALGCIPTHNYGVIVTKIALTTIAAVNPPPLSLVCWDSNHNCPEMSN